MKGPAVLKKLLTLTLLAVLAATASAQTAAAETTTTKSYTVELAYGGIDGCKYDSTHASFRMRLEGTVTTVGLSKPSTIKVTYQIIDKSTKWTIASRSVTLKKSKGYKADSRRYTVESGHSYTTKIRMSYKIGGKTRRSSEKTSDAAPTREEITTNMLGCS